MIYTITAFTLLILGIWLYFFKLIFKKRREEKSGIRGILKFYNLGTLNVDTGKLVKKWLAAFIGLFMITLIWVIFLTWKTDYNFLIAIYPFVWHYLFFRFFLWEKEDLLDNPVKK